jgi:hypothetical protein
MPRLLPERTITDNCSLCQTCALGHHVLHTEGFSFNTNCTADLS